MTATPFDPRLSEEIRASKYRFSEAGRGDAGWQATARRVAEVALAEAPELRQRWRERFADAIATFEFIPAGRALAGAGTDRSRRCRSVRRPADVR